MAVPKTNLAKQIGQTPNLRLSVGRAQSGSSQNPPRHSIGGTVRVCPAVSLSVLNGRPYHIIPKAGVPTCDLRHRMFNAASLCGRPVSSSQILPSRRSYKLPLQLQDEDANAILGSPRRCEARRHFRQNTRDMETGSR